jgi:hypothetical protein
VNVLKIPTFIEVNVLPVKRDITFRAAGVLNVQLHSVIPAKLILVLVASAQILTHITMKTRFVSARQAKSRPKMDAWFKPNAKKDNTWIMTAPVKLAVLTALPAQTLLVNALNVATQPKHSLRVIALVLTHSTMAPLVNLTLRAMLELTARPPIMYAQLATLTALPAQTLLVNALNAATQPKHSLRVIALVLTHSTMAPLANLTLRAMLELTARPLIMNALLVEATVHLAKILQVCVQNVLLTPI